MKSACLSALLLLSVARPAQAPVPLAHGDVPGEPNHHLKVENSFVRAYYVEVAPHADTQLHQHDHDYIFVSLGPADVINAVLDKAEARLVLKDGEVHFSRGGFAHIARNLSDAPFRNVTIEFLRPQGEVHNLCEKIVEGELGECHPFKNRSMSGKPYFRSEEMAVFFGTLNPKAELSTLPNLDHLIVATDQAEIGVTFTDPHSGSRPGQPTTRLGPGGMLWVRTNRIETIRNLRAQASSYLLVSFKDSAATAKH